MLKKIAGVPDGWVVQALELLFVVARAYVCFARGIWCALCMLMMIHGWTFWWFRVMDGWVDGWSSHRGANVFRLRLYHHRDCLEFARYQDFVVDDNPGA